MTDTTLLDPLNASKILEDVQGRHDERCIPLLAAGISQVEMPLFFQDASGTLQSVAGIVSMSVGLSPEEKGTHMSRFVEQLAQWSENGKAFQIDLRPFLAELRERLKADSATAEIEFKLFLNKEAPVTKQSAPMPYRCTLRGVDTLGVVQLFAKVEVPIATLCPCSKAISDFGAHNQRAMAVLEVALDPQSLDGMALEELIQNAEDAATCPVFPLLKRADEKWVTERQYTNAKFVEDVVRDLTLLLREKTGYLGFQIRVTALESIHAHNAWAAHREGVMETPIF